MKKFLIFLIACSVSLNALSNDEILALYSNAIAQGVSVNVEKREKLKDIDGFEAVILQFSQNGKTQRDVIFFKDHLMLPDILDTKKEISYKSKILSDILKTQLANAYKSEKSENILKIGNDKNKDTYIVFSDPECPYCRSEVNSIDERLKTHNIEMIFTPVHKESAHQKSALILKESKGKKDKEKIAILKKYYADDAKVEISQKDVDKISQSAKKYFEAGISSVPSIFVKSELVK